MAVNEVKLSIAANGFSDLALLSSPKTQERQTHKTQIWVAIEVTVCAVRLLCDDELREQVKATVFLLFLKRL